MGIYVPIRLKKQENGTYTGSFAFDEEYEVSGSRSGVVKKLNRAATGFIQNSKCPRFLEMIKTHQREGLDYIKVDLFSGYEHFLFGTIALAIGVVFFTLIFVTLGYVGLLSSEMGNQPLGTPEIQDQFLYMVRVSGWASLIFFMILWNIFWTLIYPKIMEIYGKLLMLSEGIRSLHLSFVSGVVNLLQPKPYWYEEGEDDGTE